MITQQEDALVKQLANGRYLATSTYEDTLQEGYLAVIQARDKYDHTRGSYGNYISNAIIRHLIQVMRDNGTLMRSTVWLLKDVEKARTTLGGQLKRAPTGREIAEYLKIPLVEFDARMQEASVLVSGEDGDNILHNLSTSDDAYELIDTQQAITKASAVLDKLSSKHRDVIYLLYQKELPAYEVAAQLGLSEGRVSQIHKEVLAKMRVRLEAGGC